MQSRSGSFRGVRFGGVERASSLRLWRSNSSTLLLDSISLECVRISSYERLSESMRFADHEDKGFNLGSPNKKRRNKAKELLSRVFRGGGEVKVAKQPTSKVEEKKKEKEKKVRPSWLPDPHRRWPLQGW